MTAPNEQPPSHFAQKFVTDDVSVGIIYQLEMINVGEQHKGAPILDARTAEFAAEQVHNYPRLSNEVSASCVAL